MFAHGSLSVNASGADPGPGDGAPPVDPSPVGTYRHAVEGPIVQDGGEYASTYRVDGTTITFMLAGRDAAQTATLGPDAITFPAGAYSSEGETVFTREGTV